MILFFIDKFTEWKISRRTLFIVFVAGFLLTSFFMAWRDERQSVREGQKTLEQMNQAIAEQKQQLAEIQRVLTYEREQNTPKLSGEINQVMIGDSSDIGGAQMYVLLTVRNRGARSIVDGWPMHVKSGSLDINATPTYIPDGYKLNGKDNSVLVQFSRQDTFDEKAAKAIERGEQIRGWLRYDFADIKGQELYQPDAEYVITFKDVLNQEYTTTPYRVSDEGHSNQPHFFPGGGMPFRKKLPSS